ncbi:MAG TPA: MATE family efflux transporter [Clostridiales bacterium]|nr:MATE family efflux transporter [Clostridiales bacterium]HQP69965.1 MATE family efflux transporter [Clostridiales bacterium]
MLFLKKYFTGHKRSVNIKKNIFASLLIKGSSIVIGFMMVPMCLDYLDRTKYGVWLTVSSVLTWFTFFEIGLGSGLRNKLAESLAVKDYEKARIYISTTYIIITIISFILLSLFMIAGRYIDWTVLFNTDKSLLDELSVLTNVVFTIFFLKFIAKLIGTVLYADQKPALANSIAPIGNLLALIIIYLLTKTTESSLVYLGLALSIAPLVIMIIFSTVLFFGRYKHISPSIRYFRFEYAGSLFSLGVKFFIIQISGLVLYHSSNIIIAQYFGPAEVTPYNIAYKLFSTINMIFGIVMIPYWSAYTEAWKTGDIPWIRRSVKKLMKLWYIMAVGGIIVLISSNMIYRIWVGSEIQIDFILSAMLLVYFLLFTFGGIFNMFINGVGKIKLQLYTAVLSAVLFYPLTYFLIKKAGMGIEALAMAIILTNLFGPIIAPVQFYKIINKKAKGIWNE